MRRPLSALTGLALMLSPVGAALAQTRSVALSFDFGGPFSLVDHQGIRRTDRDFRGCHMLIFFGYAQCKSICPVGLDHMAKALDALGRLADRVQPVFVTVDPDNDTPDAIAAYVGAIHPRLIGLTGTKDELRAVAAAYGVKTKLLTPAGDREPIYAHGAFMFLMKPDGKFATLFPPVMGPEAIAASVRRYVK
jgi:protein SCO1/2